MNPLRMAALPLAIGAGAHLLPSVLTIGPLRTRIVPAPGPGRPRVALTLDDGPDPASTPAFLDQLAGLGVRATFFVLGAQLAAYPQLGRGIVGGGHEIALHGWSHRTHLLRRPGAVGPDLGRGIACIQAVTGTAPSFWRPPHGILTGAGLWAARRLGLRPVLWTADGRDWRADATPRSVLARLEYQLHAGGVILLHDADTASARGSWRSALHALPDLVASCTRRGWAIGPLREHVRDGAHATC